jgi:hypothetical protein
MYLEIVPDKIAELCDINEDTIPPTMGETIPLKNSIPSPEKSVYGTHNTDHEDTIPPTMGETIPLTMGGTIPLTMGGTYTNITNTDITTNTTTNNSLINNLNNHHLTNNLINIKSFDENLNSGDGNINYKTPNKREDGENEMVYTNEEIIKLAHGKLGDSFTAGTKWALTKYPAGWIKHAIDLAFQNKAKSFNYIKAILEAWEVDGFPGGEAGDPIMEQYSDALFYTGVKPTLHNIKLLKQSPAELNKNINNLKQAGAYLPYVTTAERLLELIAINNAGEPLPENAMLKTTTDDVVTDINIVKKYLKSTPNIIG